METTGLSNNMGYRADVPASPQIEQKSKLTTEPEKAVIQSDVKQLERLEVDLEKVNNALSSYGLGVSFDRDEATNRPIVRVIDRQTDEVIKQYPSEDALALMKNIQNYLMQQSSSSVDKQQLTGALFNEII